MDENVQRASKLDTTALSDALDRLGIPGQCLGIKPLDHRFRLAGRAFTLLYGPAGIPPGTVGDFIEDVPEGSVIVIDNGGRENATVWGDILTMVAHHRKIGGTVIDGACRDTNLVARNRLSDIQPKLLDAHRARIAFKWTPSTARSTSATRESSRRHPEGRRRRRRRDTSSS